MFSNKRVEVKVSEDDSKPRGLLGLIGKARLRLIRPEQSFKESLQEVLEEHAESGSSIEHDEKVMLQNVLTFTELTVADVMVPRADIMAVPFEVPAFGLKTLLSKDVHTRLPVYQSTLDNIVGFLHIKDIAAVVAENRAFNMEELMRQTIFVPPSMKISALLLKMKMSRVHIAIVVDEYGGTCGLVTLEDLVEEIVGEIEDEHDEETKIRILQTGIDRFEISGRAECEEFFSRLGVTPSIILQNGEYDTVGGMLIAQYGHIPQIGERTIMLFPEQNVKLEIEVLNSDLRRVRRVLVYKRVLNDVTPSA